MKGKKKSNIYRILYWEIIHINKLCNVFRKGRGFKIGTFWIPEVFLLIIAFSKAEYHKPEHK